MRYFEVEGNSPNEILKEFAAQKKISTDFLDMEILEQGSKGILGIGRKKAKVKIKFDDGEYLKRKVKLYLSDILEKAGFDCHIEIKDSKSDIIMNILSGDSNVLIGKSAITLDSLQYLVDRLIKREESSVNILVDVDNYRERVITPLKEKAVKLAHSVKKSGKPAKLPPMATIVRREIHIAVKSIDGVDTISHGDRQVKSLTIVSDKKGKTDKFKKQGPRKNFKKKEEQKD